MWAMGTALMERQMKSTSSRSMSWTTMMPFLARKCRESSLVASLRMLFWMSSTLAPEATIFLTISAMILRSSFMMRSMAW